MYIGLTVTGPTDEVTRFREAVRGRNETDEEIIIDFNRVIPIPQEITDPFTPQIQTDEHHVNYSTSWVERNWGASSNALYTEILDDKDGLFSVQFDTPWDFPYPIIEKMVSSFPNLVFEGSAFDNVGHFYMTFEGRNGEFSWQEGDYAEAFGLDEDDEPAALENAAARLSWPYSA
jgi:Ferredoxin-like domain in Api92-like protein